jgi:hypothetical protein
MPRGVPVASPEERFVRKTEKVQNVSGMTQCWMWTGCKSTNDPPYGQLTRNTYGTTMAHQWACHRWNGSPLPIEPGMCVRHKCDVRLCVNPEHLEYGTLQENIQDMNERHPNAMGRKPPTASELTLLIEMLEQETPRREMSRRLDHSRQWIDRVMREHL